MTLLRPLRAVTFDCWGTLLSEGDPALARRLRVEALTGFLQRIGLEALRAEAETALERAYQRHWDLWRDGIASGSPEMARWMVEHFDVDARSCSPSIDELTAQLEDAAIGQPVTALEGARATLERLAGSGVRRALICDTGFSPGRVVRRLLEREGLLELLEVQIFSNEVGVPKPDPRPFRAALEPLGVEPAQAVHVGDLRRTDIKGARALGMRTIRIRTVNDDASEHPEADAVADSHAHLLEILGLGSGPS